MLKSITKKKDFDDIYKNGRSSYDNLLGIKIKKNNNKTKRFGIIVSTKVSKKAVERNKLKRQIRHILRNEQKKIKENIDCVIITKPSIINNNYQEIERSIQKNLKKLNVFG